MVRRNLTLRVLTLIVESLLHTNSWSLPEDDAAMCTAFIVAPSVLLRYSGTASVDWRVTPLTSSCVVKV